MEEFVKKYARHFDEAAVLEVIYHKLKCAREHLEEGHRAEGVKYLKESVSMISDFMECLNQE